MSKTSKPSARAQRFWTRLIGWYGARLTDQFGEDPPEDWCAVVDDADNEIVKLVLSLVRERHTVHPPTFPELSALFANAKKPKSKSTGPSVHARLAEYAQRNYPLTPLQLCRPWTYVCRYFDAIAADGKMTANHGVEVLGVEIPADGDCQGVRVMLDDLLQEAA